MLVEASFTSQKIIGNFVPPKPSIVMEGSLKVKQENGLTIKYVHKIRQEWRWQDKVAYLFAVNLHGQRPSSISAPEVSHVTVNRNRL